MVHVSPLLPPQPLLLPVNIYHVHIYLLDKSRIVSLIQIDLRVTVLKEEIAAHVYLTEMSKLYRGQGIVNGERQTHEV